MRSIAGIGCDIACIFRIEELMLNPRFLVKVYTPYEQDYLRGSTAHSAAGLWAAKEAVCKALGTGFSGFTIKDIEIQHTKSGQPYVLLHRGARCIAAARCVTDIHLSISHEREHALAFAVAVTELHSAEQMLFSAFADRSFLCG